jgi:hypothetical protein
MADTKAAATGSRIHPLSRAVLGLEVFFGVASLATIGLFPEDTATKFAWEIKSVVMAAVLGGLYFAFAPTLVLQFLGRRWEMIRVIIPAAFAFTTAEMVATALHWDLFFIGTLRFNIWLASYLLPPPLLLAMYLYQEKRSPHPPVDKPLPKGLRNFFLGLGAILTLDALIGFAFPDYLISSFPWTLTPLTARVLSGWVLVVGTLLLSMARENDRDRVRLASPVLILLLPAVGTQVIRYRDQVDLGHPRIWANLVVFAVLTACGLYLARGSFRESLS